MPYISQEERDDLNPWLEEMPWPGEFISSGGLNYVLTYIVTRWLDAAGSRYDSINSVMGTLECVKQEFYRRLAAPYENQKIKENGDVYTV